MKKISYLELQKKYAGRIVVLDRKEQQVVAYGKRFPLIFKQLAKKKLSPTECVFIGPVQKAGAINVYYLSLCTQAYRRRRVS